MANLEQAPGTITHIIPPNPEKPKGATIKLTRLGDCSLRVISELMGGTYSNSFTASDQNPNGYFGEINWTTNGNNGDKHLSSRIEYYPFSKPSIPIEDPRHLSRTLTEGKISIGDEEFSLGTESNLVLEKNGDDISLFVLIPPVDKESIQVASFNKGKEARLYKGSTEGECVPEFEGLMSIEAQKILINGNRRYLKQTGSREVIY